MKTDAPVKDSRSTRVLVCTACICICIFALHAARDQVVPFLLSIFVAVICASPIGWIKQRGAPLWLAIIIVLAAFVLGAGTVVALAGHSLTDFLATFDEYQMELTERHHGVLKKFNAVTGTEIDEEFLSPETGMRFVTFTLSSLSSMLSSGFVIVLIVIFMLLEATDMPAKFARLPGDRQQTLASLEQITHDIRRYMAMKSLVSLMTGLLIGGYVAVLGVKYPLLWGVLAFLFNFVPNIGSIIAGVPPVLMAYVQFDAATALYVAIGVLAVNLVIGNFIEPRMMGQGLGLSTLVVFLSLIFWGAVLGPVGMLLSVPLTMTVKIVLQNSPETQWISILLDSGPPSDTTETQQPRLEAE